MDGSGAADSETSDGGSDAQRDAEEQDATDQRDAEEQDATDHRDAEEQAEPVRVVIEATTEDFPHADGLAGQTPLAVEAGVRSLTLYPESGDDPWLVFEHESSVVTQYGNGDRTVVAELEPEALRAGHYTLARMVQTWSHYQIEATFHDLEGAHQGVLENLQVMSDGALVDGVIRSAGYYESSFQGSGATYSTSGDNYPVPEWSMTAGAAAVVEEGEWAVYYEVDVDIPDSVEGGTELHILVNMDEAFRWTDVPSLTNQAGEFDFSSVAYEPVMRFGGNSFLLSLR